MPWDMVFKNAEKKTNNEHSLVPLFQQHKQQQK